MSSNPSRGPQSLDGQAGKSDSENQRGTLPPAGPDKVPNNPKNDSTAKENPFSPDFKSEPMHKPQKDADIDTPSG